MFVLAMALGAVLTIGCLLLIIQTLPPRPPLDIMTGQYWFVNGIGSVEITKVLNTGSFKEFGVGVNIQYMMRNGKIGHCTADSLKKNGRVMPKSIGVSEKADVIDALKTLSLIHI